jgi:hypothetical protein
MSGEESSLVVVVVAMEVDVSDGCWERGESEIYAHRASLGEVALPHSR